MRLVIIGLAIALLLAWIGVAVRPWHRYLSNIMLSLCSAILFIIVGGFAGWFVLGR